MRKQILELSSIFGAFSHEPPKAPVGLAQQDPDPLPVQTAPLPPESQIADNGLVLLPSCRFDGDASGSPWERPEPMLWDLLRTAPIEVVEERIYDGSSGVFWGRIRNRDEQLRSVLIKFDGAGRGQLYLSYADILMLDAEEHDLLNREMAAYEAAKAFGCEDMVPPLAGRVANPVELISDAVRERIGRQLRISPSDVDEKLGTAAVLQWFQLSTENFADHWAVLGTKNEERWGRSSDQLRFSLYRAFALDFLLGYPERLLCDYLYDTTTDRVLVVDLPLSLPHPAVIAERYLGTRWMGWGRRSYVSLDKPQEGFPASGWDLRTLFDPLPDMLFDEAFKTLQVLSESLSEEIISHLGRVLLEYKVPVECIAGMYARMAFMSLDPMAVLLRPVDFTSAVLVPLRRGYGTTAPTNAAIIEFVNQAMDGVLGEPYDFVGMMQDLG